MKKVLLFVLIGFISCGKTHDTKGKASGVMVKYFTTPNLTQWREDIAYQLIKDTFRFAATDTSASQFKKQWVTDTLLFLPFANPDTAKDPKTKIYKLDSAKKFIITFKISYNWVPEQFIIFVYPKVYPAPILRQAP